MNTIAYIRTSESYPSYHLGLTDRGHAIYLRCPIVDEDGYEADAIESRPGHEATGAFIVRDDGFDLDADFETHCDDLAEESRILMAEARAEFA